jgi:hypothetical protein
MLSPITQNMFCPLIRNVQNVVYLHKPKHWSTLIQRWVIIIPIHKVFLLSHKIYRIIIFVFQSDILQNLCMLELAQLLNMIRILKIDNKVNKIFIYLLTWILFIFYFILSNYQLIIFVFLKNFKYVLIISHLNYIFIYLLIYC